MRIASCNCNAQMRDGVHALTCPQYQPSSQAVDEGWKNARIAELEQEKTKIIAWANRSLDSVKEHMWAVEDALRALNLTLDAAWNDGSLSAIPEAHKRAITKAQIAGAVLLKKEGG